MAKKNEEMLTEESREGGSRVYELGFHIDPEVPTEEVKKTYQDLRAVIAREGAIVAEGEPLPVKLAYTISRQETTGRRDFDTAQFAWIAYETSAENHEAVVEAAKGEKRLVRFIDLVTEKEAARHAEEMRELAAKASEKETGEEADAALDAALENVEA